MQLIYKVSFKVFKVHSLKIDIFRFTKFHINFVFSCLKYSFLEVNEKMDRVENQSQIILERVEKAEGTVDKGFKEVSGKIHEEKLATV